MSLTPNSRVVVIGGTSGIGLAIAQAAAATGARVVVGSRRQASVDAAIAQLPDGSTGIAVDASSTDSLSDFFTQVGEFDHLAYTAGEQLLGVPLNEYTPEKGQEFLNLRVVRCFEAVRLAASHLRPGGSITLTSGTAAYKGGPGWLLGCAASGAIVSAARSLAVELAPLRINVVAPGVVRTPLWGAMSEQDREQMYQAGQSLPLGRVAEVEDVAKSYLQLGLLHE